MSPRAKNKHNVASSLRIRVGPRIGPDIVHLKKKTLREHRLYLMKQVSRIADQKELLLGPVDDWPQGRMTLPIPLEAYDRFDSEEVDRIIIIMIMMVVVKKLEKK